MLIINNDYRCQKYQGQKFGPERINRSLIMFINNKKWQWLYMLQIP